MSDNSEYTKKAILEDVETFKADAGSIMAAYAHSSHEHIETIRYLCGIVFYLCNIIEKLK